MKLLHVVPAITKEASGPSYSVRRLCDALLEKGETLTLAALDWGALPSPPAYLKTFAIGLGPARLGASPGLRRWLKHSVAQGRVSVVHNHGMWQMNALYPAWAVSGTTVQLVCSPRGALSEWAMSHGSKAKKVFWPILQRPALRRATCFHATAMSEYEDIRRLGFSQPVAVIPNGIDIPTSGQKKHRQVRVLLFLGRVHQKKGLDLLLPAWQLVQDRFPEWRLVVAGSDEGYHGVSGYLDELKDLVRSHNIQRVDFVGGLHGPDKQDAYFSADIFVLPTYSENFGMTVAEALAAGTPAIVSKGAPWEGLEKEGAGWWVDIGIEPLADALADALSRSPDALADMGQRGRDWMQREFSWALVGERMAATYRWLVDRSLPTPPWVRLD